MDGNALLQTEYANKTAGYYDSPRPEMLAYVPQNARKILDIGCGSGAFGRSVKEARSAEVWGVEMYPPAAEAAAQKLDRVLCAAFDARLDLPEGAFDCILCNDVLEHLADPYTALRYCRRLLTPDGVLIASIPNIRYFPVLVQLLIKKDLPYEDHGVMDRTHLRFFTENSIRATFSDCGYTLQTLEGIRPDTSRTWRIVNLLLLNHLSDACYPQFAVVARPKSETAPPSST